MNNHVTQLAPIVTQIKDHIERAGSTSGANRVPAYMELLTQRNAIMREWKKSGGTSKEIAAAVGIRVSSADKVFRGKLNAP